MSEKKVYFNKPQRLTQLIDANSTAIVAGRRTGKTDSIAAPFVLRNMQRMPGSTGGIVVPAFKHGLTNTISSLRYGSCCLSINRLIASYSTPDILSSPISLIPCINKGITLPFAAKFLGEAWRNEIFLSPIFIVRVDPVII